MGNDAESGIDQAKLSALKTEIISIGKLVADLPAEIRASAFQLFVPLLQPRPIKGNAGSGAKASENQEEGADFAGDVDDISAVLAKNTISTPSDAVRVITAYWFSQYGSHPIALSEIKKIAAASGLTIPERVDMNLKGAQEEGKGLYQAAGRGLVKPTTFGEAYLRKTFGVAKGTKTPAKAVPE